MNRNKAVFLDRDGTINVDRGYNCRKPRPGLFYYAAAQFNIDFRKSFAVGNELRDLCICSYEPVTGILLSEGNEPVGESGDSIICLNDLYSACRFISEHG